MKTSEFRTWFEQLPRLSRRQAEQVRHELGETARVPETVQWLEQLYQPRCDGEACYHWGHPAGLQRFRCRTCGRTFTATSGTPLARLRLKSRCLTFCEALKNDLTVRASAALSGVDKNTSFRWGVTGS